MISAKNASSIALEKVVSLLLGSALLGCTWTGGGGGRYLTEPGVSDSQPSQLAK